MKIFFLLVLFSLAPCFFTIEVFAKEVVDNETENLYNNSLESLFNEEIDAEAKVGSRGKAVGLLKSKTPVDVVTAEQIKHSGYTELSKVLQRFIPGFNFPRASIQDGTDHIRPFTLRGMAPDQVLVLVNGKRFHSSSILHINSSIGRGSTGVDLNSIPLHSIARVEVLRDGAAAQYGSDAIAGIINIILKSGGEERRLTTTIGQTYEGDGELYQTDLHYGITLPLDGFIDITAEFRDRNPISRAAIDTRQQYFDGDIRNNYPSQINEIRGDTDTQNFLFALNSELPLSNDIMLYFYGTTNYRESESGTRYRRPLDNRNVRSIYPNGFLPLITPKIFDYSATMGLKGETLTGFNWDFSHSAGGNHLDYGVKNSLNVSLGVNSPTSFDAGGLGTRQHVTNLDIFKKADWWFENPLEIAVGLEWRYETFSISSGDESAFIQGGIPILDGPNAGNTAMAGAQGFPGFGKINEIDEDRHNFATYIDLNTQFFDKLSLGIAGRYEYYSDFGSTLNGKFSLGYQVVDSLLLRGSVSSGFRAPSLQQSFFNNNASLEINEEIATVATISRNSQFSKEINSNPLKPEKSQHLTIGLVFEPITNFSLTADYFYTKITDRIVLSGNIGGFNSPAIGDVLRSSDIFAIRSFLNALDTETQGYDLRANYKLNFQQQGELKLTAAYHYNKNKAIGEVRAPAIFGSNGADIVFSEKDRERLELGQPNDNLMLMANYKNGNFNGMLKLIKSGAFSEAGQRPNSQWLTDIDLAYQIHSNFNIAIGVHNLFDTKLERETDDGNLLTNAPYGHGGGFYYFRLTADF